MAKAPVGKVIVEIDLDKTKLEAGYSSVKTKGKRTATEIEQAWKSMGKKTDATYDQMKANIIKNYNTIKNHATSTADDIVRAERAKNAKIAQLNKQQFGEQKSLLDKAKEHWIAYAAAIAGVLVVATKIVKVAMEQEKAEVALSGALKASGEYTKELIKSYADYASGIQKVTTYGDEEVLKLMALQKNLGVTTDRLKQATEMSIGLAAATGRDVQSMAMYIALAEQGEFTMLRRYIPALRSTTDETEQLKIITEFAARGFLVAKENALTFSGGLTQLGNLWGDLKERMGNVIVKNKALLSLMDNGKKTLIAWIDEVERWVNLNGELIKQKTEAAINSIASSIKNIVTIYNTLPSGVIGAAGAGIVGAILFGPQVGGLIAAITYTTGKLITLYDVLSDIYGMSVTKPAQIQPRLPGLEAQILGYIRPAPTLAPAAPRQAPSRKYGPPQAYDFEQLVPEVGLLEKNRYDFEAGVPGIDMDKDIQAFKDREAAMEALTKSENDKRLQTLADFNVQYNEMGKSQFELERERIQARSEELLVAAQGDADMQIRIGEYASNAIKKTKQAETQYVMGIYQNMAGNIAGTFLQIAQAGGKQSKAAFRMYQAFAIAQAYISGALAYTKTLAEPLLPWPGNVVMANIIAGMVAVQIALIASAKPPSYDEGGISRAKGVYQTGNIDEAHIPLKGGKVPVSGGGGKTFIIKMENPVFQDVETQRQVFAQIAEVIATRVAPDAVVASYGNDERIRNIIRSRA